jgi:REP element-mobilizing transposase RayT
MDTTKNRRTVRLHEYDYTRAGAYFVTICAKDRECSFGNIERGIFAPSSMGEIVAECWGVLPRHFDHIETDAFIVMPNHIHGILVFRESGTGRGTIYRAPTPRRFGEGQANSLATVIGNFKAAVTRKVRAKQDASRAAIWQRNYYEHIVRDEDDLNRIRRYIIDNPARWAEDEYYRS